MNVLAAVVVVAKMQRAARVGKSLRGGETDISGKLQAMIERD
jgi:hypothetical protein